MATKNVCVLSQSQMDKLASCHAITELVNWISLMERVIGEDEEKLKGAVGSKVIQEYLQRYKVGSAYESISSEQTRELISSLIFTGQRATILSRVLILF